MSQAGKHIEAEARYRAGDFSGAAALLAAQAETADTLRLRALCLVKLNRTGEALKLFERAREMAPADPWVALHYGIGLQSAGRHEEATKMFRAAAGKLSEDPAPWLNLSGSLLALGDVTGAIAAARKGRLRNRRMAQAHYVLGLAYLAAGLLEKAADCFATATKLQPDFADAWVNLGVARYRSGKILLAREAMRAALRADPGNVAAAGNLGAFLRLTGEIEAAETVLRGVIAANPNAATARINFAADLLQEDRAAEALELLDGTVPQAGEMYQQWALQRILALIRLGRMKAALEALEALGPVPPGLLPLVLWRRALLAAAAGDEAAARAAARDMAAALRESTAMVPEHAIMAHYDLAKFWSQRGDHDSAFQHWVRGHKELARFQPFSRTAHAAFIDANIALFDAARFAGARASNADTTPVFVVGMPRSGTTLTEQILAAHGQVHGAGERAALARCFWENGGGDSAAAVRRVAQLQAPALDDLAGRYLAELHSLAPDAARIVDKMPANANYLGLMALLMPGAKVIACERDPRDIGLSIFTFRFYGVHAYANDLADLGWYIGQHCRLMAHWRAALPNPIFTVKLSDWVEDFDGTLRRMLAFLDLPYDAACERFHEVDRRVRTVSRTQVRSPINSAGIGRWRAYERHLQPLITELRLSGALTDTE
jgi:tetratricopeptide (TPR) repeat protein